MSFKPGDFFFTVIDFFSILLPGSMLALFSLNLFQAAVLSLFPVISEGWKAGTAFFFSAYLLGHFVHLLATRLDWLDKRTYRKWYGKRNSELAASAKSHIEGRLQDGYKSNDSTLEWCTAFLRTHAGSAISEIDRLEADSKFFRSLSVVLLVGAIILTIEKNEPTVAIALLVLLPFSLWRYMERRLKRSLLTYQCFLVAIRMGSNPT